MSATAAIEALGLGKRYGSRWALRECTLEVPAGSVTALVGPNGAARPPCCSLRSLLSVPSSGRCACRPRRERSARRCRGSGSSRRASAYRGPTVAETPLGRKLNPS
jgi:ABC-2 type transport system ATP-binding protein